MKTPPWPVTRLITPLKDAFYAAPLGVYALEDDLQRALETYIGQHFFQHEVRAYLHSETEPVIGPDFGKWNPDYVLGCGETKIAVELKFFHEGNSTNHRAELARGLGQCMVYADDYDAAVLLVVHQLHRKPRRLHRWGFVDSADSVPSPIMLRDPAIKRRGWLYGFDRWNKI